MATERSDQNEIKGNKGAYIIEQRPFAFGSASTLWLARDANDHTVCVKMFHDSLVPEESLKQFMNEFISRQTIEHPNILPILDHGNEVSPNARNAFIVLPYCRGGNLRKLMHGRDFLSPQIFMPILEQVATAVDFAHANGIIHGDIKPENILFRDEERKHAWLGDFGIATFFPVSEEVVTGAAPVAGSTAYLSPEQISENRQSSSSDIYALAMVAYEALTGKLPFDTSAPPFKQMYMKVEGQLLHPSEVNARLTDEISEGLLAGLDVDSRKRPRTAVALYRSLQAGRTDLEKGDRPEKRKKREFTRQDLVRLYRILTERFNEEELRSLCFELGDVDYDGLPGSGTKDKARELISYLARRKRVNDLVMTGKVTRPDIEWI